MKRLFLILACLVSCTAHANETLVKSQAEYRDALKTLRAGDTIILANGEWRDFEIVFEANGTADKPITLRAQDNGEVIISGESNLRLAGQHLVVRGLVFRDGHTPTNEVISFRRNKDKLANHTRVTEVVIDHFNNPERFETDFWVIMHGRNNRFDHNHLVGKSNSGVTMAVRLDAEASQNNHHRIDHNYFGPRPVLGSNGGETLRIGTSKYSLTDSYTVVENNYFDRCDGEVEIISNKSGRNTFRGNVFYESRGTLTLRHGNDNLVENNVFFGNGVDHTGGIRLINKRQTIRNNYLSGLKGYRFGGALVVMNGVPDSPINRYHQVEDSVIENNTIIDSDHVELAAGSDDERSAVPISTLFRNNLIVNTEPVDSIAVHDDISGITFDGNVVDGVEKLPSGKGFSRAQVTLGKADNGLFYPDTRELDGVGVSRDLAVLRKEDSGVPWYPKAGFGDGFDTGLTHTISPGQDSLTEAMTAAAAGDVIELRPGEYRTTKLIIVDRPLTVRGQGGKAERATVRFERSTLFEIVNGGSLKLEGITIDGSIAPDGYGNSVVRTSRYSMLGNYQLVANNIEVLNLDINHSFNFLKVSMHTFASRIEIRNSSFKNISGHVVALDREVDDLGIYNGEYITIADSSFSEIAGSVATIYRGGTDESTFGPHFLLTNSTLTNVGKGKRNKTHASIFLHGVQVASIDNNVFTDSEPVRVTHTVGDPVTRISGNTFNATDEPQLLEL